MCTARHTLLAYMHYVGKHIIHITRTWDGGPWLGSMALKGWVLYIVWRCLHVELVVWRVCNTRYLGVVGLRPRSDASTARIVLLLQRRSIGRERRMLEYHHSSASQDLNMTCLESQVCEHEMSFS